MAIDFPNSPSPNQVYTVGTTSWIYSNSRWELVRYGTVGPTGPTGSNGAGLWTVSDTAPTGPSSGSTWYNSTTGKTYVYYDSYWVEVGNTGQITTSHSNSHINGGGDVIDGDRLQLDYVPTNYTRNSAATGATDTRDLTAHINGIDSKLVTSGTNSPNAPTTGTLWYDTSVSTLKVYNGTAWVYAGRTPGGIIECLTSPCDGSSATVTSGTYTFQNVTALQNPGATNVDITGSTMAYTPPVGATKVTYEFSMSRYWEYTHDIMHFRFFIDSDEVTKARFNNSGQYYPEHLIHFFWTMNIGGSNDTSIGRVASWSTAKTLKMQVRDYGTGNGGALHGTTYWDGAASNTLHVPNLRITAIA